MPLKVVRTVSELRAQLGDWKCAALTVGLVPTMGALHDGHLSLVRRSLATCARTCVTLFVNPKQFGTGEDLAAYPRDEAADVALAAGAGAHLVFAPRAADMYPQGFATRVAVPVLGDILEGEHRPGFFTGVATVVATVVALDAWFNRNHEERIQLYDTRAHTIAKGLEGIPGLDPQLTWRSDTYYGSYVTLKLDTDALGKTAGEISNELLYGEPSILMRAPADDTMWVWVYTLNDGEDEIIVNRLREVLA